MYELEIIKLILIIMNNNPNGIMNFKRMDDGTNKPKKIAKQEIYMLTYIVRQWVTVYNELMFPYQKKKYR